MESLLTCRSIRCPLQISPPWEDQAEVLLSLQTAGVSPRGDPGPTAEKQSPAVRGGSPPSSRCTQCGQEQESQGNPGTSPRLELNLETYILSLCLCGDVSRA